MLYYVEVKKHRPPHVIFQTFHLVTPKNSGAWGQQPSAVGYTDRPIQTHKKNK